MFQMQWVTWLWQVFDTNEILESTSGMLSLASASGEDLATVTDILTDSMTGFGDSASDASRYADVLATVQAKSNTTVGDLGEAFTYVSHWQVPISILWKMYRLPWERWQMPE